MKRARFWLVLGGLTLLAAAAGYQFSMLGKVAETPTAAGPATPILGTAAALNADKAGVSLHWKLVSDLVLADLKGQPQSLGQWRGKVLVVNYWATWCYPCREEMPFFSRLQDKYRDRGVQFVGISIDNAAKIAEFQKLTPVSYPLLIGDMDVMANSAAFGNTLQALPFTAIFDRQGKLVATKLGRFAEADLERQLLELM